MYINIYNPQLPSKDYNHSIHKNKERDIMYMYVYIKNHSIHKNEERDIMYMCVYIKNIKEICIYVYGFIYVYKNIKKKCILLIYVYT
jgi:hypothetical protein